MERPEAPDDISLPQHLTQSDQPQGSSIYGGFSGGLARREHSIKAHGSVREKVRERFKEEPASACDLSERVLIDGLSCRCDLHEGGKKGRGLRYRCLQLFSRIAITPSL